MYQVCRSPSGESERPAFMARVEILSAQLEEGEAASSSPPAMPLSTPHAALATSHASPPPTSPPPHASPPLPLQQAPLEGTLSVPWRGRGRRGEAASDYDVHNIIRSQLVPYDAAREG